MVVSKSFSPQAPFQDATANAVSPKWAIASTMLPEFGLLATVRDVGIVRSPTP